MKVVIFLGKAFEMGIKPKEFAEIIVRDIFFRSGDAGLRQLKRELESPEQRKRVIQLERQYTGKGDSPVYHSALEPYVAKEGTQYVPFEQLEDALMALLANTLADSDDSAFTQFVNMVRLAWSRRNQKRSSLL